MALARAWARAEETARAMERLEEKAWARTLASSRQGQVRGKASSVAQATASCLTLNCCGLRSVTAAAVHWQNISWMISWIFRLEYLRPRLKKNQALKDSCTTAMRGLVLPSSFVYHWVSCLACYRQKNWLVAPLPHQISKLEMFSIFVIISMIKHNYDHSEHMFVLVDLSIAIITKSMSNSVNMEPSSTLAFISVMFCFAHLAWVMVTTTMIKQILGGSRHV